MKNIYAVIVTYNIGEEIQVNIKTVINQVVKVIIVDNGSREDTISILKKLELSYSNVKVIYNYNNIGLDKAQNIGINYILSKFKSDWILLLDNDSSLSKDFISNYFSAYESLESEIKDKVGMIVPNIKEMNANKNCKYITTDVKRVSIKGTGILKNILTSIASGSMIKVSVLKKIGLMDECFFIDSIDIEYSLRLNSFNYMIIGVESSILFHTLGQRSIFNFFGMKIVLNNHSPFRRYYIFRNRIIVWKRYLNIFTKYVIYDFFVSIYEFFKIIFFENNKNLNLKKILIGIRDGFFFNDKDIDKIG